MSALFLDEQHVLDNAEAAGVLLHDVEFLLTRSVLNVGEAGRSHFERVGEEWR